MSAANRPFNNNASKEERQRLVAEASLPTSYHKLAGLADDLGGRFAVEAGQSKATKYPKQDSASPWSGGGAQVPDEMPTGVEIDAQEPVGEQFEIEASIAEQELGEPGTGAIAQGTHPPSRSVEQLSESAVQVSGSPPELDASETASPCTEHHRVGVRPQVVRSDASSPFAANPPPKRRKVT